MALRPISRIADYEFPPETWDVRGWAVRTSPDDEKVGRVADMLLDRAGALRYLDVNLGFLRKHVLVPLDHAFAERSAETVWIEQLTKERLEAVPEYALDPESLDEDYERRLDTLYGGSPASAHRELVAPTEDEDRELDLERLGSVEGEYRVAGDDPRDWKVVTGDGRVVGRVVELLVEPGAMRAAFLDVALDEKELELEPVDRHILLPTDRVRLERSRKKVVVSGLLAHDLGAYPQYGGLPVRKRQASELHEFFGRGGDSAGRSEGRPLAEAPAAGDTTLHDDWRRAALRHFYRPRSRARATNTARES